MPTALLFDNISKHYGRSIALDGLSLRVEPGEIFGFLGPNGAGKTTAIHLAMGFLHATSGRGEILGLPFGRGRVARARVGYVPDAPTFFAGTALDAVLLAARLNSKGGRGSETGLRARALELLRSMDLPAEKQEARKFSRGMQQRLALAQALVTEPALLILDEPTSALDPLAVQRVREALERARERDAAIFFSSHQLHEVELLCDRAAFLEGGRLLEIGRMADLLRESEVTRVTLRGLSPDSRFVEAASAALDLDPVPGARGDLTFRIPATGQRAFLESAWQAGAELIRVGREHQTLEGLFSQRRSTHPPKQE